MFLTSCTATVVTARMGVVGQRLCRMAFTPRLACDLRPLPLPLPCVAAQGAHLHQHTAKTVHSHRALHCAARTAKPSTDSCRKRR